MIRAPILASVASVLLLASPVRAQSAEDRAAADALYAEAGELLKADRFAEACPKLETSQRLDPGIGTLIRLGYCLEHVGRSASAWSAYHDAEALAVRANDKRAGDAAARAKALEPRLSRLLIAVASQVPELKVLRDGKPMDAGLLGTAVPVDPGEHVIEASAPGRQSWKGSARVSAAPGTTTTTIPALVAAEPGPVATGSTARTQWTAGIAVAGVGAAVIAVGAVLGGVAIAKKNALVGPCRAGDPYMCNAAGVDLHTQALTMANASNAAFAVGGAALVTGAVLFFTAPKVPGGPSALAVRVSPEIAGGTRGVWLSGSW